MDDTFQLRANRPTGKRHKAALDFSMLTAALAAQRAVGATEPVGVPNAGAPLADPLTELLLAGPDWRWAASAQRGCFNRAESRRRRNAP
jgi:hypothetical protein